MQIPQPTSHRQDIPWYNRRCPTVRGPSARELSGLSVEPYVGAVPPGGNGCLWFNVRLGVHVVLTYQISRQGFGLTAPETTGPGPHPSHCRRCL